ncbi:MAG: hypothetical protein QOH08_2267 [Chloroflexota bacterium]|jgi:hypothetical protein|nr:hypothetical protein [Chloroflexota bacterium]
MPRSGIVALLLASALVTGPACTVAAPAAPDPLLVLNAPGAKSQPDEIVVVDLSGREVLRRSTGSSNALASLHAASAQVAFWRRADAGAQELVVWNISSNAVKAIATAAMPPAAGPVWSVDGSAVVTLHTSTPLMFGPGATFEGTAEISVVATQSGQFRRLETAIPFVPLFANADVVAGETFSGDKRYIVVDARSGQLLRELSLTGAAAVLPTADPDVVIAMYEATPPGVVMVHVVNTQTPTAVRVFGPVNAQPMPSWPGRSEVVFVEGGDLKAFDYRANATRIVGRFDGAIVVLSFDTLGTVLLVARAGPEYAGTFTVGANGLTSAVRPVPLDPSLGGGALGLVRIKP